jgi:putative flippase GtrA
MSTGNPGGSADKPRGSWLSRLESHELTRYAAIGGIGIYAALFVVLNTHKVGISFVFFTLHVPVLFAVLVACAIGIVGGWLLHERFGNRPKHPPR